jgi:hypothetical protein
VEADRAIELEEGRVTDDDFEEVEEAARGWSRSTFRYIEDEGFPGCGWGAIVVEPIDDEEPIELDALDEQVARPIVTMLNACPGLVAEVRRLAGCLAKANANHEEFERRWYLATDEVERLRGMLRAITDPDPTEGFA